MGKIAVILLAIFFSAIPAVSIFESSAVAQTKQNPNTSCVSATCHSTMGKDKFVHGPIAVGECVMCHFPLGQHTFARVNDTSVTCYKCHNNEEAKDGAHRYSRELGCTKCHDAHQSPNKYQLRMNEVLARVDR